MMSWAGEGREGRRARELDSSFNPTDFFCSFSLKGTSLLPIGPTSRLSSREPSRISRSLSESRCLRRLFWRCSR